MTTSIGETPVASSIFQTPTFIGRADALESLERAFTAQARGVSCVLLEGEAGVGKSRLLAEFHERVIDSGAVALIGHCIPMRRTFPLVPVVEVFRQLMRWHGHNAVEDLAGAESGLLAGLVPELAHNGSGLDINLAEPSIQGHLFEQILGFLSRLTGDSALVFTIEDLQWADVATLDLLSFLAREVRDKGILLIGSYRPEELTARDELRQVKANLQQMRLAERLELAPFSRPEVRAQIMSLTGEHPSRAALDRIFARSQGNPFLVEELVESGIECDEVPRTVWDTSQVRASALSDAARSILQVAAVAGSDICHDILRGAVAMDHDALNRGLRDLVEQHFLLATDQGYEFRHALLREAVYKDLLPGERIALHASLAGALREGLDQRVIPDPSALGRLAYHSDQAGDLETAILDYYQAARASFSASAFHEANAQFKRMLDLAGEVAEVPVELDRIAALRQAAHAANLAGDQERAVALVQTALERNAGSADAHVTAVLHLELSGYLWQLGNREESIRAAEMAATLIPKDPPSETLSSALSSLARARMVSGELGEARSMAEQALRVAQEVGTSTAECTARRVLGLVLALQGAPQSGEGHLRDAVRIARQIRDVEKISVGYVTLALVLESMGRLGDASATIREARAFSRDLGFERSYGSWLTATHAHLCFKTGDWDEARQLASEVLGDGHPPTLVAARLAHATLAALDLAQDRSTSSREHAESASRTAGRQWYDPVSYLDAERHRLDGDLEQALALVSHAIDDIPAGLEGLGEAAALCWLGLRLACDLYERARTLRAPAIRDAQSAVEEFLERHRAIVSRLSVADLDSFPEVKTLLRMGDAEHIRLKGNDPDVWRELSEDWRRLEQPYPRAYALYREAEAALAGSMDRARADRALSEASVIVGHVGADALGRDIEGLARRARIDLAAPTGDPEAEGSHQPSPFERLGLTPREVEVLQLLVEGKTNPEIADVLYISAKTASVHVSHILMKLQVTNRVEAAGVAHRLALV